MACSVNFVWNYCNSTSMDKFRNSGKRLTDFELNKLTSGCSKELGISSVTIQSICKEYVYRRNNNKKKIKLNWRSSKRSLGWIPIKSNGFMIENDIIIYCNYKFRFWKSQDIIGNIKTANFSQDAKRHWYINIQCEIDKIDAQKTGKYIGIDLGLKTIATGSNGHKFSRDNITRLYENKLGIAQRAGKKRQVTNIHATIRNKRLDWAQKTTTNIVNNYDLIVVGDICPSKINKTNLAKSVNDAGWYQFKSLLAYKAIRLGKEYKEVRENFSTVTCSVCLNKTGLSGLSNLGVREWKCDVCGTYHDRDINAAINILRFGHESPKGIHLHKLVEDVK